MTIIEKNIIDKIKNYKTIFIYGGWGIGKTHFAKNVLYEEMVKLEKKKATLYIDARLFDQDKNMFDYVAFFARKHKSKKAKFRNFGINGSKVLLNSFIFASNNFFKTNIEYSKINKNNSDKEDVEVEIKEMHEDLVIIIDELDRLTPDTIIKTLNFINGLSIMNEKIQIILIGNKKELESILSLRFNISTSKNSFLHKYFELEISMDSVVSDYAKEVFSNNDNWKEVFQEWELSGSPREIERSLLLYKNVKNKYKECFSEDVFRLAFHGELMDKKLTFYSNGTRIDKNQSLITTTCSYYENNEEKVIQSYDLFNETRTPAEHLNEEYKLTNFDQWVKKYFRDFNKVILLKSFLMIKKQVKLFLDFLEFSIKRESSISVVSIENLYW